MRDAKFVAPQSRMEGAIGRALLALNSGLFLWALAARVRWGDAPDHSTGFVFLTGSLVAQSLRDFVTAPRLRWVLLITASVLLVVALTLIARRATT